MNTIEKNLNKLLDNKYVSTSLIVFLILYSALAAPSLSKNVILGCLEI